MRRLSWIFAVALVFVTRHSAGIVEDVSLGIHAGASLSTINTPGNVTSSDVTGFGAGVAFELPLGDVLYLQPEASFVQRGSTIASGNGIKVDVKYETVEIPVFLKAKFGEVVRPYVFAGPQLNLNVASRIQGQAAGQTADVSFDPNTLDFAGVVGAGLEVGNFFTNLRFEAGMVELNKNSASWRSRGFLFLLGLKV